MTNKILCPIDFSDTSEAALKFALTLAREQQRRLVADAHAHRGDAGGREVGTECLLRGARTQWLDLDRQPEL